jgi:hypothetical protein
LEENEEGEVVPIGVGGGSKAGSSFLGPKPMLRGDDDGEVHLCFDCLAMFVPSNAYISSDGLC